jgi:CHRD domain
MNTHWSRAAAALAIVIAAVGTMLACSDDPTGPQSTTYVAQLSGTNEVPGLSVGATGTATFTLNGKSLSYRVTVRGLSGTRRPRTSTSAPRAPTATSSIRSAPRRSRTARSRRGSST